MAKNAWNRISNEKREEIKAWWKNNFGCTLEVAGSKFSISLPTASKLYDEAFKECYPNQQAFTKPAKTEQEA